MIENYLKRIFIIAVLISSSCSKDVTDKKEVNTTSNTTDIDLNQIDAMKLGVKVSAPTPQPEKYFDDLIHPCVRFIPKGFAGHKWWMIASPYRGYDSSIENPILYYGDSTDESVVPTNWIASGVMEETPKKGYNSDPSLYYDGKGLWVFWRENYTPSCSANKMARGTFGKYSIDGTTFTEKKFFAGEKSSTEDSEMCPIIASVNGQVKLYGDHHLFTPNRIPLGLSIWDLPDNDLFKNKFVKTLDVLPKYKSGFDFWHFDFFEYNNKYYCVVSPESANEILLGRSDDGINYVFWDTPLLSNTGTGRTYFYKPTALVYQGIFYLWNPVAEIGATPATSRIWISQVNFAALIRFLDKKQIKI
ncbi:hypothetical protein H4V97_001448 [Flavobacterium sp. CG_23.5]|uniref:hypothetical protein n=1 Tax=Flavobacterium sp. CG_23.5 TaxID=2760708 RepID=UPI001AE4B083|nr:hypothetical protein [Flavobacterium sp. CG_23.5]MBP2283130.1 hypothetical protein [Flavobacterium sp. CG_23.5]